MEDIDDVLRGDFINKQVSGALGNEVGRGDFRPGNVFRTPEIVCYRAVVFRVGQVAGTRQNKFSPVVDKALAVGDKTAPGP